MKKFIFLILSMILIVGFTNAQDFGIPARGSYIAKTFGAGDTITSTATLSKSCGVLKGYAYYYDVVVDIDTVTGGGDQSSTVTLSGSNDNVNFYTIGSTVTFSASADTIIQFENLSTRTSEVTAQYVTTVAGTETTAAFIVETDTTGLSGYPADSLNYPQMVNTVAVTETHAAQTNTIAEGGVMWNYLRISILGDGSSVRQELQAINVKVAEIP